MSRRTAVWLLLTALVGGCAPAPAADRPNAQPVSPRPGSPPALDALAFADATTGWAAGPGVVLRTTDGGNTWRTVWRGRLDITQLVAVSPEAAVAVGAGHLLATSDGGRHWASLPSPAGREVVSTAWSGPSRGYVVALSAGSSADLGATVFGVPVPPTGGTLWETVDAGRRWAPVDLPGPVQSVCVASPTTAYAVAGLEVWRLLPHGMSVPVFTAPLRVHDAPAAVVACRGSTVVADWTDLDQGGLGHFPYVAFVSRDNGATWRADIQEPYTHLGRPDVTAPVGPGTVPGSWTVGRDGTVVYSGDSYGGTAELVFSGPQRFVRRPVPGVTALAALAFVSHRTGFAVVARPGPDRIIRTTDGGRHWRQVYPAAASRSTPGRA